MKLLTDIAEFHEKFGLEYHGPPRILPPEVEAFRRRFLQEELEEWATSNEIVFEAVALKYPSDAFKETYTGQLEMSLDAMVDLAYVLFGTVYLQGLSEQFMEAWNRVHEKNMQKVRVEREADSKRGSRFDVVKPEGWTAPDLSDLVERNELA